MIGPDDLRHGKKPAVTGNDLEEVADQAGNACLFNQRHDRAGLILGGKNGTLDETPQVGAVIDHRLETVEILGDGVDRIGLGRQLIKRGRIPFGDTGNIAPALG